MFYSVADFKKDMSKKEGMLKKEKTCRKKEACCSYHHQV